MSKDDVIKKATVSWSDQTRKLREEFITLTEKDLYFDQGELGEMIKRVQNKVGITKHQLYQIITKE